MSGSASAQQRVPTSRAPPPPPRLSRLSFILSAISISLLLSATSALDTRDASKQPPKARVLFLGDSLTSCSGLNPEFTRGFLSYRRPLWKTAADAGWAPCMTWVGSRSGCNARLDRNLKSADLFPQQHDAYFGRPLSKALNELGPVLDLRPDVVVVCLGINDLILAPSKVDAETIVSALRRQYRKLLTTLLGSSRSRQVIVLGLPPLEEHIARKRRIKRAATLIPSVNVALSDVIGALSENHRSRVDLVNVTDGFAASEMLYDGLHPGEAGEQHIARLLAPALYRAVVPLSGPTSCG